VTRIPRPLKDGEPVVVKPAHQLNADDYGCIIQTTGHRGWLQAVAPVPDGIWVCTTTGVNTYPPATQFQLWGHDDQQKVLRRFRRPRPVNWRFRGRPE
jgi:hypothetical protein